MSDGDRLSKSLNTTWKVSLQKLLQKRTGRAAQRPPKEPKQSDGSRHQQQHEADFVAQPPVRAPPPDIAVASSIPSDTGNTSLDPDQVRYHMGICLHFCRPLHLHLALWPAIKSLQYNCNCFDE